MIKKVLISDAMHPSIIPTLSDLGFEVDYFPDITREKMLEILNKYYGLIIRSKTVVDAELIDHSPKLRFIARAGAGLDQIAVDYVAEKNIEIINAPEGNRDAVGEHALGMLICIMNHIHRADRQIRSREWLREANRGHELQGKTVAIIGYGNMGQAFARRLSGFDCQVLAYDKYKKDFSDDFAKESTLEKIFDEADVLSFHVPLTPETRGMANDDFFKKFKKKIYLVNTARGEILPLKALLNQVISGKIMAAALDVLENEKFDKLTNEQELALHELFKLDNVLFTPHVAGWSEESYIKINEALAKKIKLLNLV